MKTILITGGTGLIGQELTGMLLRKGYKVSILTRHPKTQNENVKYFIWNVPNKVIDPGAFKDVCTIIHLSGANIGNKRWTNKRQGEIYNSRINSTRLLLSYIKRENIKIEHFISASAIGYYGTYTSDLIHSEESSHGNDVLAKTCIEWEREVLKFQEMGILTTILRTGIVLSLNGGVLNKMITPAKFGLNAPLGNGMQYMPWIHITDLCSMYLYLIEYHESGIFNAVSSEHCTNLEFSKSLSKVLQKPFFLPHIPSFLLKLMLGKMSAITLQGSRVSNDKIKKAGFNFKLDNLNSALEDLLLN